MADLRLTDYGQIKTAFCFVDETGLLHSPRDRFFSLGMIKCPEQFRLCREIEKIRLRNSYFEEIKWSRIFPYNLPIYKDVLNAWFSYASIETKFCMMIVDKKGKYFNRKYQGDPFKAFEDFSIQMLQGTTSPNEIISIIVDEVPLPDSSQYDVNIKNTINNKFGRFAVHGVCMVDSKGHDILQVVDLLIGAITYDYKIHHKLAGKGKSTTVKNKHDLLDFVKRKIGVNNFIKGHRDAIYNIKPFG